jgi:hypothetical protein|nr:MAG TPA_asm: hypothetical protein [Caudoviricetes sp.]
MKNQISEDIKRAICKRNNYETAKKLLDDYYYSQCGHIDSISRDRDLERLFPIKVRRYFDVYTISSKKEILCTVPRSGYFFRHERYHDMHEVLEEIDLKK